MCHLREFTYLCGHSDTIVISPCRRTAFKTKRSSTATPAEEWLRLKETGKLMSQWKPAEQIRGYVPACRPSPSLTISIRYTCGVCLFEEHMREWNTKVTTIEVEVSKARGIWEADDCLLWRLQQDLGEAFELKSSAEWRCRQQFPTMRHSPPAKRDEIGSKVNCGSPLRRELTATSLIAEIEEEARPVDEQGVPYTTFWDFFSDRYMWMGPGIDWSEEFDHDFEHNSTAMRNKEDRYLNIVPSTSKQVKPEAKLVLQIGSKLEFLAIGPDYFEASIAGV